jgi:hypothetical protein
VPSFSVFVLCEWPFVKQSETCPARYKVRVKGSDETKPWCALGIRFKQTMKRKEKAQ